MPLADQLAEVWARLDRVTDPELDDPITDMGFVETVSVTGAEVAVAFRLPTYWCSPNFAFLMAEGIKREVEALPWVSRCRVSLEDHMAAEELMTAVNAGGRFSDAFAELTGGEDLTALREKFARKAFQRRQEVVVKALLAAGTPPGVVVSMTLPALDAYPLDPEASRQRSRYTELLRDRGLAEGPAICAFDGTAIAAEGLRDYMGLLRSVRINMEFSGSLCRGLKETRYKEADLTGAMPVLVDLARRQGEPACR